MKKRILGALLTLVLMFSFAVTAYGELGGNVPMKATRTITAICEVIEPIEECDCCEEQGCNLNLKMTARAEMFISALFYWILMTLMPAFGKFKQELSFLANFVLTFVVK